METLQHKILGLDIGDKTIGVAVSDLFGMTAQGVTTLRFKHYNESFKKLAEILEETGAKKIVAGLPLHMNGSEGAQAQKVRTVLKEFLDYLQKRHASVDIEFIDERLSTVAANRSLLEADLSRAKRKEVIDKMAAVFILQGYLDGFAVT